jgi:hypothetical protein
MFVALRETGTAKPIGYMGSTYRTPPGNLEIWKSPGIIFLPKNMKESPDLFIRISHPWETVKTLIDKWQDKCNSVAVYQHDADEDVSRTHCHIILKGCTVGRKRLQQLI